jgi:hypothetical protein
MPRYFFHTRTYTALAEVPQGTDLPTLETARAEAIIVPRQMAAAALRQNRPVNNRHIDIHDADGRLVARIWAQKTLN